MNVLRTADQRFTRWLTAPEPNAAGRMSLFRILYGLFYLWNVRPLMSFHWRYHQLPATDWHPIPTIRWLNPAPPDVWQMQALDMLLIGSLVFLIAGLRTRWATLMILLSGALLAIIHYSFQGKIDHGGTFMFVYIPAVMLFSRWNSNYSLDAFLKKRATDPKDTHWLYIWPVRVLLILLSFMFFGAGYSKLISGQWLTDPQLFPNLLLTHNVVAIMRDVPPNPLSPIVASIPVLSLALQFSGVLFELFFPLALFNRRLCGFFIAAAVVFHGFNYFFLTINARGLLIVYLMFVDWQRLYERWLPFKRISWPRWLTSPAVIAGLMVAAVGLTLALLTNGNPLVRLLKAQTTWTIATPIGLFLMLKYGLAFLRQDVLGSLRTLLHSSGRATRSAAHPR